MLNVDRNRNLWRYKFNFGNTGESHPSESKSMDAVVLLGLFELTSYKDDSTNVESKRYSDYFNPMPDISNNNFSKKLKPDNMIGTLGWSEF